MLFASATVTVGGDVIGGSTNGDKGVDGNGAYIVLQMLEEDADAAYIPGALTVKGTLSGGNGSHNAPAICYCRIALESFIGGYIDLTNPDIDSIWETEYLLLGAREGVSIWLTLHGENHGLTEEVIETYIQENEEAIAQAFYEATGTELTETADAEEAAALIDALPDEKRAAFRQTLADRINAIYDEFYQDADAPTITVWGLRAVEGADLVGAEGIADTIKQALAADINYFVRTAPSDNGTVSTDRPTAKAGEAIVISPVANEGYQVTGVQVGGQKVTPVNGV